MLRSFLGERFVRSGGFGRFGCELSNEMSNENPLCSLLISSSGFYMFLSPHSRYVREKGILVVVLPPHHGYR